MKNRKGQSHSGPVDIQLTIGKEFDQVPFNEYLIIISPPVQVKNDIAGFKKLYFDKFSDAIYRNSLAHITLCMFHLREKYEDQMLKVLYDEISPMMKFNVVITDFGSFDYSWVVYLKPSRERIVRVIDAVDQLVRSKVIHAKGVNPKITHPHLTVAKAIHKLQFDKSWYYFKNLRYTNSFVVNEIELLKRRYPGRGRWKACFKIPLRGKNT